MASISATVRLNCNHFQVINRWHENVTV